MVVKKSLMILSISLILLISISFVSANFWDWLNGDVTRIGGTGSVRPARQSEGDSFSSTRTSFSSARLSGYCPFGWSEISSSTGSICCVKKEGTRTLFRR